VGRAEIVARRDEAQRPHGDVGRHFALGDALHRHEAVGAAGAREPHPDEQTANRHAEGDDECAQRSAIHGE
jgi:hypothetical protein